VKLCHHTKSEVLVVLFLWMNGMWERITIMHVLAISMDKHVGDIVLLVLCDVLVMFCHCVKLTTPIAVQATSLRDKLEMVKQFFLGQTKEVEVSHATARLAIHSRTKDCYSLVLKSLLWLMMPLYMILSEWLAKDFHNPSFVGSDNPTLGFPVTSYKKMFKPVIICSIVDVMIASISILVVKRSHPDFNFAMTVGAIVDCFGMKIPLTANLITLTSQCYRIIDCNFNFNSIGEKLI